MRPCGVARPHLGYVLPLKFLPPGDAQAQSCILNWQVLAGLATPTEGTISVGSDSDHRPLSSKVGIVFQFPER